jgi:integrase
LFPGGHRVSPSTTSRRSGPPSSSEPRKKQSQKARGTLPTAGKETLAEYLRRWLDNTAKPSVGPTTFERYEQLVRLYARPYAGKLRLDNLAPDAVKTFLAAVAGNRLEALFVLALATGMRQGELLGLFWDDIDFDFEQGTVSVRRALAKLRKGGFTLKVPKTKRSRRTISLPPSPLTRSTGTGSAC